VSQSDLLQLKDSPIFQGMAAREIEFLDSVFTLNLVAEGKTIFIENMPGEALYLIGEGTVQVSQMLAEADEKSLLLLGSGDVFGEMAVIDGGKRVASARVIKKTQLYSLSRKDFNSMVREKPRLGVQLTLNIARIFSKRVRQAKNDYHKMLTYSLNRQG